MVRETGDGVVKVKVSFDGRVHDKIEEMAKEAGLSVPKFIAEAIEGLALDPTLRLLHDDPALAREVAAKALSDYLDGKGVQVIASSVEETELDPKPEPDPEPSPLDEARQLVTEIETGLEAAKAALGMNGGGSGKGPESVNSEPPRKAMGRGRQSRAAPPRR